MKIEKGVSDDQYCFACGRENPYGLHMEVTYPGETAETHLTLPREFQGWNGVAHGGIIATLLDEIMAHVVIHHIGEAATASLTIRYRDPLPIGVPFQVRGWISEKKSRLVKTVSELRLLTEDQKLIATGESKFLLLPGNP